METFKDFITKELEQTQAGSFFYDFFNYKSDFTEKDVTIQFLDKLKEYALGRVSPNSAKTYLSYFRTGFYKAERSGYNFPINYDDVVKYLFIRPEASENIYMTRAELKLLELYDPISDPERFAKLVFLLCAYTGCRISDYPLITEANFNDGTLQYTCIKTKRSARLPLHPLVPKLVRELRDFNYPTPSATAIVGDRIKQIYMKLGVNESITLYQKGKRQTLPKWKFISSHTARRSFATNCYLSGYSIKQVSSMMGHTNTSQTEGYIIASFADEITGDKSYLTGKDKSASEAMKLQLLNLGISGADADSILAQIGKLTA